MNKDADEYQNQKKERKQRSGSGPTTTPPAGKSKISRKETQRALPKPSQKEPKESKTPVPKKTVEAPARRTEKSEYTQFEKTPPRPTHIPAGTPEEKAKSTPSGAALKTCDDKLIPAQKTTSGNSAKKVTKRKHSMEQEEKTDFEQTADPARPAIAKAPRPAGDAIEAMKRLEAKRARRLARKARKAALLKEGGAPPTVTGDDDEISPPSDLSNKFLNIQEGTLKSCMETLDPTVNGSGKEKTKNADQTKEERNSGKEKRLEGAKIEKKDDLSAKAKKQLGVEKSPLKTEQTKDERTSGKDKAHDKDKTEAAKDHSGKEKVLTFALFYMELQKREQQEGKENNSGKEKKQTDAEKPQTPEKVHDKTRKDEFPASTTL
ncbi:unnamed protein product, partial [Mesorhabditis spiculigera]